MKKDDLILLLWGGFFAITFLYYFVYTIFFYYYKKVKSNSFLYKNLEKINEKYLKIFNFDINNKLNYTKICKSKKDFDNCQLDSVLELAIESELVDLSNLLLKIDENKNIHKEYLMECETIFIKNNKKHLKKKQRSNKIFDAIEKNLYLKNQLQPILAVTALVSKVYTTTTKNKKFSDDHLYSFDELNFYVAKVKKNIAHKKEQEYKRKIERAKVTPSLRWQILKLDNYKCRVCNAGSVDGVKLHIDHIVPIAKNGTSDISNLQTLCETCNFGKSDKI